MVMQAVRKWVRNHGIYTASVTLPSGTSVHRTWTKGSALEWLWLHSKKQTVAAQQFSKVTDLFGQRIAVRYYR